MKFLLRTIKRHIGTALYWLRTHTYNRYHYTHVDVRGMDSYSCGWIDRDHQMMLVCFKLLCDYIDEESGIIAWDYDEQHRAVKAEMDSLYHWWKVERPEHKKQIEEMYLTNSDKAFLAEQLLESQEDENLIRLMKIRRYLWS